jgi:beta-lactamase regulating signal transducer with metallopeptidase domain
MNAFNFLSNPVADALGWTLLHAIWQGFVLVLPVAVVLHLLRNQSSELRYRISVLTLLMQVIISAGTFFWHYQPAVTNQPLPQTTAVQYATLIRWQTATQVLPWHQQMGQFLENHLSQFVLIYLIGVALFGVRLAGGWLYLQRLTQTAIQPTTGLLTQLTDQIQSAMAIRTLVRVRESARVAVPMVVGVLKPVLLIPISLAIHLTPREIEVVLAHELAHIKRHDYAVNLLQSVVEVLYFFHPALWWLSARVREEREHCCDDLAVQVCGGDGRILAQALARVEELRFLQLDQAPKLAMAFAAKRQHLLNRVRRVLGVPTRPFVSNSSLAGLTLATILLMSVSVYAVQQDEKPKQPKPKSTQRFSGTTSGNQIEYSMTEGRMTDIKFKGKQLPKAQVQRLQHQLDQVMNGQLNFDDVKQPDRDILLTVFEKSAGFEMGMKALSEGMAHINYDNIVASALKNVPLSPDGTVEGLAKVNYDSISQAALALVPKTQAAYDSLDKQRTYHQRKMDSLSQLMAQRSQQMETLHRQMEKMRFPIEEVERSQEVLNWRKDKLMEQRNALIEKHQRLLHSEGKQKLSQAEIEKQLAALEPEIKKLEGGMEEMNKQFEAINAKEEQIKQPMEKLEREAEQLEEQMSQLSEQMGRHSNQFARMMPMGIEPPEAPEAIEAPARAGRAARPARTPRPAIAPVRPLAPPVPLRGQVHAAPAIPAMPASPSVHVAPTPKPVPAPKVRVTPAPKPAPTPKPN